MKSTSSINRRRPDHGAGAWLAPPMIPRESASVSAILQRARPSISSGARPAAAGSTAVISAKCSSMKGRCRTRRRINRNDRRSVRNARVQSGSTGGAARGGRGLGEMRPSIPAALNSYCGLPSTTERRVTVYFA